MSDWLPYIDRSICTGCGACISSCPTSDSKEHPGGSNQLGWTLATSAHPANAGALGVRYQYVG